MTVILVHGSPSEEQIHIGNKARREGTSAGSCPSCLVQGVIHFFWVLNHFLKTKLWGLALITLTIPGSAQSSAQAHVFGRVYSDQYFYTQDHLGRTSAQNSVSAWLGYESHNDQGWGARAVGQVDTYYRDLPKPTESSIGYQLREGYGSFTSDGWDARLGQQIIPWGKSDGINPTDYFTAKNYTLLTPDDEVRRQGAPALNLNFTPREGTSPFSFQFVGQAYYPQANLLIPDQAIPAGLSVTKYPKPPAAFHSNAMEAGVKISYLKSDYDLSLSYFQGYSAFPEFVVDPSGLRISPINPKETAMGMDGSFTTGSYVIRFESAVHLPENGSSNDGLAGVVEPSHWDTVVGAERTFLDDFRVQLQGTLRQHLSYRDPSTITGGTPLKTQILRAVAKANALILNFQQQSNPGATARVGYASDHSNWTADIFLIGYFGGGQDFILRPQVGYQPIDNLKFLAGADFYGGDPSMPLGALKDQSVAFFEGKYQF